MAGSDKVNANIDEYTRRVRAALHALWEHYGFLMEAYAKENRPWTDRTDMARKGLFSETVLHNNHLVTRLSHSMGYGVYLELAMQQRFAIIEPTIKKLLPDMTKQALRIIKGR